MATHDNYKPAAAATKAASPVQRVHIASPALVVAKSVHQPTAPISRGLLERGANKVQQGAKWAFEKALSAADINPKRPYAASYQQACRRASLSYSWQPNWDAAVADLRFEQAALIIVDYRVDATFAEQQLQSVLAQANVSYKDSQVEIRKYNAQIHQLRLRLVGDLFPEQAHTLDTLIEHFKTTDGATGWTGLRQSPR